jgi:phage terminase Nu1 subunit (DNA packaging protein)
LHTEQATAAAVAKGAPPQPKKRGRGRPRNLKESFEAARTRKESHLADLRGIEVDERRGKLLNAQAVEREWSDMLRQVRAGVMAVVSRVRARLPHLTGHDAAILDQELRAALAALGGEGNPSE